MSGSVNKHFQQETVAEAPVSSVLSANHIPYSERELSADEEVLQALGYKPEFRREFSLWTTFCVSFAIMGILPSTGATLYYGMGYAGTAGMVWGWLIAILFIQCVALSMAELCSSMPTSGGLYYASAVLAPPGWGPFAAWLTGWSNWLAQVTAAPSIDYALSTMILAAASIRQPSYIPQKYQVFLLTVLTMLIQACISSGPTRWIARFNSVGTTFNMVALLIVIVLIPTGTNRAEQNLPRFTPSPEVWGKFYHGTSFPTGIAVVMSFVSVIWTMAGFDSPFHLSEECSNANVAAPRAIVLSVGIGGAFGWFLQLLVAYTVIDIPSVITSDLGQPWASYLLQIMPQKTALAILALTIIAAFSSGQGAMVSASRTTYAYARDDCLPLSRVVKKVNKTTQTPVNAVWFNTTIGIGLLLLIFGGPVAISSLFSIGAVGQYTAFTIPIFIRVFFVGNRFRPGPWNLGRFSTPVGVLACTFVALMVPILMMPGVTGSDLKPQLMNWTCLVYGAPMLGIIIWWFLNAHKWFKGPKVNVEHQMLARDGNNLEGSPALKRSSRTPSLENKTLEET
ncbi:MAG: hypothetical protein M1835_002097 [Candelina submexicana]|nr:MAG: hypothetical protein M1835_002097 [Candelina submexicana]